MKEYILNSQQIQDIINILQNHPYAEVHVVMAMLLSLKPIEKKEG